MDRSYATLTPEFRAEGAASGSIGVIEGYACKWYREDDPGTEFRLGATVVERIMPGAFAKAIDRDDVRALFNHDSSQVLGRNLADTLRLVEDEIGLRYYIDVPDTSVGADVAKMVQRGDVSGSSFAFVPDEGGQRMYQDGDLRVREISDVFLYDVGPVTYPAYESSEASVRCKQIIDRIELDQQQQQHVDTCRAYAYAKCVDLNID